MAATFETAKRRAKVILATPIILLVLLMDAIADAWDEFDLDIEAFWSLVKQEWRGDD